MNACPNRLSPDAAASAASVRRIFRGLTHPLLCTLAVALGALLTLPAHALSVLPPTFEELVAESAGIVRAEVVAVEPFRTISRDGTSVIKTRVTWRVLRSLKGAGGATLTLEFLGGRVAGEALDVPGIPSFEVGDQDFLFVEQATGSICPLLAAGHGRYRVQVEARTGRSYIARDNRIPLVDLAEIPRPLAQPALAHAMARAPKALTPEAFEAVIVQEVTGEATNHAN